jgi:hypothetical protein
LPSVESITAETDIRAFLAPGVPVELVRAALRRGWAADPAIRDHIGLSENSWDFNAPGAMPGFGPLEMTDDLRQAVERILGSAAERPEAVQGPQSVEAAPQQAANDAITRDVPQKTEESRKFDEIRQHSAKNVAAQTISEKREQIQLIGRKRHGRALPRPHDG